MLSLPHIIFARNTNAFSNKGFHAKTDRSGTTIRTVQVRKTCRMYIKVLFEKFLFIKDWTKFLTIILKVSEFINRKCLQTYQKRFWKIGCIDLLCKPVIIIIVLLQITMSPILKSMPLGNHWLFNMRSRWEDILNIRFRLQNSFGTFILVKHTCVCFKRDTYH